MIRWLALLLLLTACQVDVPRAPKNGEPAPRFSATRLDGQSVSLPEAYRGQVIALRFWADWCPYCGPEMRAIEPVYQRLKDRGLVVLAVNAGQAKPAVERFLRDTPVSYPVLLDLTVEGVGRYGVVGLPQTYLIDREGILRGRIFGETSADIFEREVTALLQ